MRRHTAWLIGGVLVLTAVIWHLSIVSSIASKGDEPSPFGWFFYPGMAIMAAANVGVVWTLARQGRGMLWPLVVAGEAAVQFGYATLYRASHHIVAQDTKGWAIDLSATVWTLPVLAIAAFAGYKLGDRGRRAANVA